MEQKPRRTRTSAKADAESIRLAMNMAWRGQRDIRSQIGKAVLLQIILAAGLFLIDDTISTDDTFGRALVTTVFGLAVIAVVVSGLFTTLRARKLEIAMVARLHKCEEALDLHRADLLAADADEDPEPLCLSDIFRAGKHSGLLLLLRIQAAILLFAVIFVVVRVWGTALFYVRCIYALLAGGPE